MNRVPPSRFWCVLMAALLVGCSGQRKIDYSVLMMADVSGTVTLDGSPLEGVTVSFTEAKRRPPRTCSGVTDSSGRYRLFRKRDVPGCLPGEMVVEITRSGGSEELATGSSAPELPAKYNRRSQLREMVEAEGEHVFDFELTSS